MVPADFAVLQGPTVQRIPIIIPNQFLGENAHKWIIDDSPIHGARIVEAPLASIVHTHEAHVSRGFADIAVEDERQGVADDDAGWNSNQRVLRSDPQ